MPEVYSFQSSLISINYFIFTPMDSGMPFKCIRLNYLITDTTEKLLKGCRKVNLLQFE